MLALIWILPPTVKLTFAQSFAKTGCRKATELKPCILNRPLKWTWQLTNQTLANFPVLWLKIQLETENKAANCVQRLSFGC